MTIHSSITEDRVIAEAEENTFGLGNTGICVGCGEDRGGCEPDARRYPCESCGRDLVFGAEEIILCGYYHREGA